MTTKAGRSGKLVYILTTPSTNINSCCPPNKNIDNLGTLICPYIAMNVLATVKKF